jgi:hypothetical protein
VGVDKHNNLLKTYGKQSTHALGFSHIWKQGEDSVMMLATPREVFPIKKVNSILIQAERSL